MLRTAARVRLVGAVVILLLVTACQISTPIFQKRTGPTAIAPTSTTLPASASSPSAEAAASVTPRVATPSSSVSTVAATPQSLPTLSTGPTVVPTAAAIAVPSAAVRAPVFPTAPARDLIDLQRRLRPGAPPSPTPSGAGRPALAVGSETTFWIANQQTKTYFQFTARVVLVSDHTYWYVQDGVDLPTSDLQTAASFFESQTYPTEHRLFGSEWSPGIDGDVHITVLIGHIPDVGGYFSSADEYPRQVNPYSNEREMFYVNVDSVRPGTPGFNATVAHEFMHMIQFNVHRDQESWLNEGSAELAAQAVTGTTSSTIGSFENQPSTQLTQWASEPRDAVPHYGAAYLFVRYVAEQLGGFAAIGRVVAEPGRGVNAFDEFFQSLSPSRTFDSVFSDWVAANALADSSLDSGRYGYRDLKLNVRVTPGPSIGETTKGLVTQFAATYYDLRPTQPASLTFRGSPSVQLIGAEPHDARFEWWSNRGDSIDSRLTRSVDLTSVKTATLGFWIWYDIEDGYDYGYVEASDDGGQTWKTLKATDTTAANPNGQNYGNGFTGTSGGKTPTWTRESVDLGSYAGRKILLRFEYVTDESYNGDGFAVDRVQIPEVGLDDGAETDNGWLAEGFSRTDNRLVQTYLVEVLAASGRDPVRRMAIATDNSGTLPVDPGQPQVVAVSGTASITIHQSSYELQLIKR